MSLLITNIKDINWYRPNEPLKGDDLFLVENNLPFTLPKKFIDLLKISDGGRVDYDFDYYDVSVNRIIGSGISVIYGAKKDGFYNLLYNYYKPPEGFPKNLVAFAGDSDQICLDYRGDPKTDNPPVVYWNFEAPEGKDISPLADDFMGFLRMLREPEPIENYLKK